MDRSWSSLRAALLGGAGLALMGGAAAAQEAPPPTDSQAEEATLDEVVVTARFRREYSQDIGASIRAIGGAEIARAGMADFQDIARRTPGVQLLDRGPNQNEVAIRGIAKPVGAAAADTLTARGVVTFFVDDILTTTTSGNDRDFNLFDLNRVEVLRGPQPTYFGEGSVGGTIRYFTNDPSLDGDRPFQSTLNIGYSSTEGGGDNTRVQGLVDVTLVPDRLGVRVSAYSRQDDGFIDNTLLGLQNVNDLDSHGGRFEILARPGERLTVSLFGNFARDETGDQWDIQPNSDPDDLIVRAPVAGKASDDYNLFGAKVDYGFDWGTLTSVTGSYKRTRESLFYDPSFTFQVGLLYGFFGLTDPTTSRALRFDDDNFTQEFRLSTDLDGPLNFTAGLFFKDSDFTSSIEARTPGIAPFTQGNSQILTAGVTGFDTTEWSGFLEATWAVSPVVRLIAGGRYLNETQTASFDPTGFVFLPSLANRPPVRPTVNAASLAFAGLGTQFDFDLETFLPRVAAEWDVAPDILAYGGVSKGVRNGGLNAVVSAISASVVGGVFNPATFGQLITYDDDAVTAYELGLKSRLFQRALTLNVGLFFNDWQDIQTVTGGALALIRNAGAAESKGAEIEASWTVNDTVRLFLDASYTDAEFKSRVDTGSGVIAEGNRLPGVPEYTANVGADLTWPLQDGLILTGRIDYQYLGERFSSPVNFPASRLDSLGLLNLRAGIGRDDWTLSAFASNLTNDIEVQSSNVVPTLGALQQFVNRPRTVGLELTVRY